MRGSIKAKVNNRKNKLLSYAGRLQLIASILSSMQVYWASVFILPKSVVKEIDKLLKGFLWCQGALSKGKAKVAWKQICRPKDERGLGESIWTIDCDKNASHGWKQILSLRDKMRNHIVSKIGDGASVFLWHDKWWGPDPITKFIPLEVIRNVGLDTKMKLKEMVNDGKWRWPKEWNNAYQNIATIPVPEFDEKKQDTLSTQERLQKWYPEKQMACTLCGSCPDSNNHLFFECCYSKTVWGEMKKKAELTRLPDK
ncbi:RNA-directed DNA polymerase, eukaryota, reverse transcriptase zinc-binding domain protein [Tanacetum coccineum]